MAEGVTDEGTGEDVTDADGDFDGDGEVGGGADVCFAGTVVARAEGTGTTTAAGSAAGSPGGSGGPVDGRGTTA